MAVRTLYMVSLLLGFLAARVSAQAIVGTLVDETTGAPVRGATVVLFDDEAEERARTTTDGAGAFRVTPGSTLRAYWIRVERAGFATVETRPFVLARGERDRSFALTTRPEVVAIEGVTARAPNRQNRNYAEFLRRQRTGWGRTFAPEELARIRGGRASDMLLGLMPGVDVVPFGPAAGTIVFTSRGRNCTPVVVVDGVSHEARGRGGNLSVDELVIGSEIRAIEVYSTPMFIPAEVAMSPFNSCGAVVLWTAFGLGLE